MTSTRDRRWQFSVRSLLLALACCSLVFAVLPVLGVVAGSTAAMMLAVYLVIRRTPLRWQIRSVLLCLLFAMAPHFGGGFYFGSLGGWQPPQLRLHEPPETLLPFFMCIMILYAVAEFPVHLLGELFPSWDSYVFFQGEGVVHARPFAVWTFWLQMAAVAVLAIFASLIERRRSRSRNPLGLAEQTNVLPGDHGLQNQVGSQVAAEPAGLAGR